MIVTEQTKAMAQEVYDYLVMNPERHKQDMWVEDKGTGRLPDGRSLNEENICGTVMCAAGTTVWLAQGIEGIKACLLDLVRFQTTAAELLGLETIGEARALFLEMNNEKALNALLAIANGDEDKFYAEAM